MNHPARSLLCTLGTLVLSVVTLAGLPRPAQADAPQPALLDKLRSYDAKSGDLITFLRSVVPGMAQHYLKLSTDRLERGGPLPDGINADLLNKLDAAPGSLPMVIYKKEDGRLPGAFILARYRGVTPAQMVFRMNNRAAIVKHPLVDQYLELAPVTNHDDGGAWGVDAKLQTQPIFTVISMPFGAGLFGLRDSFVFGDWENVLLPNGVALSVLLEHPPTAREVDQKQTFRDKKNKDRQLNKDYYPVTEYRLTSLLVPERDAQGQVANTVEVYFVRIVPALKPGTTLIGSGPLARWLFTRGSAEALVTPIKLVRDEIERIRASLQK